jgi:quinolinate synthase
MYGVADAIGDSYGLSRLAMQTLADVIVFCSVYFMAETAKLLNPEKTVLVPKRAACSLADSITAEDVVALRKKYPKAGIVCYVNTTAAVKAQSDVCCTSANALKIVEAMPQKEIVFIPDELMAKNLAKMTRKKIIPWKGRCVVHEGFTPETVREIRKRYPRVKILAHPECTPAVISEVDFVGGTTDILEFVKKDHLATYMLVTECGITERVHVELPGTRVIGSCALCPYMKQIMLKDVLQVLRKPQKEQVVFIEKGVMEKARRTLDRMFEMEKSASWSR